MTHASQDTPKGFGSRRQQRIATAIEFVRSAKISPEMRRAILGNKKRSPTATILKLYNTLTAKTFPVSEETRALRAEQDRLKAERDAANKAPQKKPARTRCASRCAQA